VRPLDPPATIGSALRWARNALAPSSTASLDAALLLGHVVGRERSWVLAHDEQLLSADGESRFGELIAHRATGVPVAYLRGYCEWFGLKLHVTPEVLVPRPETEQLVEETIRLARDHDAGCLVDVGTGSGAIAVQLARSLPDTKIFGIDSSSCALEVARRNAATVGVSDRIGWLEGNLLEPLEAAPDMIVANLPYLSDSSMTELDRDVRHEPLSALYGGPDGLDLYRQLFQQRQLRGWSGPVVMEIDPRQASNLTALVQETFSETHVRVLQDYAGRDRIVVVGA
jgi:release factor glutamine methyltransferase